jgi:hypothetical protein
MIWLAKSMKRVQLHLSTLLIGSLLAGGLIWCNVRVHTVDSNWVLTASIDTDATSQIVSGRGWPLAFQMWYEDTWNHLYELSWWRLALNVLMCLLLLGFAAAGIEWTACRTNRNFPP